MKTFGENAPEASDVRLHVYRLYLLRPLRFTEMDKREMLREKAGLVEKQLLEQRHGKIRIVAASWDALMVYTKLLEWKAHLAMLALTLAQTQEREREFFQMAITKKCEGLSDTISKQLPTLERAVGRLGQYDHVVRMLHSGLVQMYGNFEKWELAKKHLKELIACEQRVFGKFDHRTIQSIEKLAFCEARMRDTDSATKTWREVHTSSHAAFGDADPRTVYRERQINRILACLATPEEKDWLVEELIGLKEYFSATLFGKIRQCSWKLPSLAVVGL